MADLHNILSHNEYHELLYAYSLGCLDKEELFELNEYFQTENEFPWQELGEYQNLVALLPAILNVETPGPELKDKVARKLYRIKNERRPKKTSENIVNEHPSREVKPDISKEEKEEPSDFFEQLGSLEENEEMEHGEELKNEHEEEIPHTSASNAKDIQEQQEYQENSGNDNSSNTDEIDKTGIDIKEILLKHESAQSKEEKKNYHLHGISEPATVKKGKSGIVLTIIFFVIILAGAVYLYHRFSLNVEAYKTRINNLDKKVSSLTEEVSANKEVQKIFQMKDTRIVNLYSPSIKDGYGKVIINFQSNSGFLQLSNIPELSNEKSYQLWLLNEGKAASLGDLKLTTNKFYYPILLPAQNFKGEIRFLVTEESSDSSAKPSNKVYLSGVLQ